MFVPKATGGRFGLRTVLGRLRRDERGVTAIEFGLLAVPFFAIVGAIIETALIFFAGQVLDSATGDAARAIRTGQAQTSSVDLAGFRSLICGELYGLFNCDDLMIKVSSLTDFSSASLAQPVDKTNGTWKITSSYSAGGGNDVVMVQVYYKWPTIIDLPGVDMSNLPDGTRLLSSVHIFQNEPFGGGS